MPQLQVPERYAEELHELAQRDARTVQEVVSEAMDAYLSLRLRELPLTPNEVRHLETSRDQADRLEMVSAEAVESFFDEWEKEAASR